MRVFQITDPKEWGSAPGASQPTASRIALLGFVGLALLVGVADGALASGAARIWVLSLNRPAGALTIAEFGPAWGVLQTSCGVAGWLAWRRAGAGTALRLWGWVLAAGAARAAAFFGMHNLGLTIGIGAVMLGLLAALIRRFGAIHRPAAWLMVPSLLWTVYILYLDVGFLLLNPR
ncbi:MAG: TspO/MBR family protein [Acetobacteraceae bacterium]